MKPVQAMGVFHDQNGSIFASVAVSDTIISARPNPKLFTTRHTEDTKEEPFKVWFLRVLCVLRGREYPSSRYALAERAAAERRRADALSEDQDLVCAPQAAGHQ